MAIDDYRSFDRISYYYDFLKTMVFGSTIDDAQKYFLDVIPPKASVLIIGGGTGKLLVELLRTRRVAAVTYLEFSEKMIQLTKKRLVRYQDTSTCKTSDIDFRLGSIEALNPNEKFDTVFTPFVLDVMEEKRLHKFMKRVDSHLYQEGLWFFSDFKKDQSTGLDYLFHKFLLTGMLFFFNVTIGLKLEKLPDFDAYFDLLGYKAFRSKLFYRGFIQSKVLKRG